jgi:hypothetical protein
MFMLLLQADLPVFVLKFMLVISVRSLQLLTLVIWFQTGTYSVRRVAGDSNYLFWSLALLLEKSVITLY